MVRNIYKTVRILAFMALISVFSFQVHADQQKIRLNEEALQDALVCGISMGIPGISVAIGMGDEIVWTGTAGYSDISRKIPVESHDRFGIGSITKTFVARVILQLAEEGKLGLDKKAVDYVDQDIVHQVPNTDNATLRELLNHQSGIPTWEFQPDWIRKGRGAQMKLGYVWGKTETLEYVAREGMKAEFEPGERYSYSNTNYTILGLVIEAATGNEVMTEIRNRILKPLKLEDTFLESFEEIPGGIVHHYHYATPHFEKVAGVHRGFTQIRPYLVESTPANLSPEWVAGGMVSSASDLVRWAQAIRNGELLGPEMKKEVYTYYPPEKTRSNRMKYMQGVMQINDYYKGHTVFGHSGGTLGFTALMYWFEEPEITVVVLTNVGRMHSGLSRSPVSLFFREVLLPAVMHMN
ncbi:MAG: serine hydrolase domain-containing protein [Candidatus Aminicenantaceae bacterium]